MYCFIHQDNFRYMNGGWLIKQLQIQPMDVSALVGDLAETRFRLFIPRKQHLPENWLKCKTRFVNSYTRYIQHRVGPFVLHQ